MWPCLAMPDQPSWFVTYIQKKSTLYLYLFLRSVAIWSVKIILDDNLRPRILPDKELEMESQVS